MTDFLDGDESALVDSLSEQIDRHARINRKLEAYYEGSHRAQQIGISIPPSMRTLNAVLDWPAIVVDSLEERLDLLGLDGVGDGVQAMFAANNLDVESGLAHLDALMFGISYVTVSAGAADDEPDVLVVPESPKNATARFDRRVRRLTAGLVRDPAGDAVTLLTDSEIVELAGTRGRWEVLDRTQHGLGVTPMVAFPNRRRASRSSGRSQITRAVRSLTDQAVRTLLGMEVNREFYSSPQRWIMGASEDDFKASDGTARTGWELVLGAALALPRDDVTGEVPQVGQFSSASPAPFADQLRVLSQLLSAGSAVPRNYLGFVTDNPSSADAIRAEEARLIKHAERRQALFGMGWRQVARLIAKLTGEDRDDFMSTALPQWRDAATPTRAAAADATTKLVSAGIIPARGMVTLEMAGMDARTAARVQEDWAESTPAGIEGLAAVIGRQSPTAETPTATDAAVEEAGKLKTQFDALGVAIRAGVDPENAAAQVGLSGVQFTGAVPVSLRVPEKDAAALEE